MTRALNEALTQFAQKLEDTFGSQMSSMNDLLMRTTESMQVTVARFDQLAGSLDSAGRNTADAMGKQIAEALRTMESRQLALNDTMRDFVGQLRDMVQTTQQETSVQLTASMAQLGENLNAMAAQIGEQARRSSSAHFGQQELLAQNAERLTKELGAQVKHALSEVQNQLTSVTAALGGQAEQAASQHQAAQQQLADQSREAMNTVGIQVNALAGQALAAVNAMQDAVASMRAITLDSTRRMENSAETLAIAADDFAKAGGSVVTVAKEAGSMSEKLVGAAQVLSASSSVIRNAQDGYETASKVVADMVAELRIMVDTARQEAGVSRELVGHLRESAVQLSAAQSSIDGYFERVCEELAKAHQAFGENVESTLKRSNGAFQKELKDAVDYLKAAVEELGDVADAIPAHKR